MFDNMKIPPSIPRHSIACFGEVLWDLLPSGPQPGGAPMNVAYHLHKLNRNPAMISRTGKDERGRKLLDILQNKGVCTDYIQQDDTVPTGIVNAQQHANGDMTYEIVAPAAWDHITADDRTAAMVEQADYFVFGSLACRHPASRETLFQLLEKARTKVLDINLRAPHYDRPLIESLLQKADILKLNIDELELVSGWYPGAVSITARLAHLRERFSIPVIVLTMGANGAMLDINGKTYNHPGYKMKVVDTVGSGDAFLAATLSMMQDNAGPADTLDFANRLAATITTYKGACPDYDIKEADSLKRITHI
ncbi:carbohydrate kinase [Chitinophaga cymbidii]|uniref:Carbohydrate kinase n=2 Tax=Chitinophaga cymbidii TaxID=1096750 RepID=A0A512RRI4_9BACT|nr:carbohydrate kinase [Chitinophaga cymbidii]